MNNYKRMILGGMAVSLAMGGAALAAEPAPVGGAEMPDASAVNANEEAGSIVRTSAAEGTFAWDQATVTPNDVIAGTFRGATATLCGSTAGIETVNPLEWKISVGGDVRNAFTATVDEMAADESVSQSMTCSCGANPADGRAIVNADVKGVPVTYLIERAAPEEGANAITFVSSDGTEQTFPLGYVIGRHAVISYSVNGEDLSASVGGNNQLWMTRTAAGYFVRDIVEVRITKEDVAPANPGEDAEYPNSPNVGVLSASVA